MPGPLTVPIEGLPLCPSCLGGPMGKHGKTGGRQRFRCGRCGATRVEGCDGRWAVECKRLVRRPTGWMVEWGREGFRLSRDSRGRRRVQLGADHPWANTGGWLYLYQFVVADDLGRRPAPGEQVHHRNGRLDDDRRENLEVLAIAYHGRLHATAVSVAGLRGPDGRFVEHEVADDFREEWIARWGAVLGQAARELQRRAATDRPRRRRAA